MTFMILLHLLLGQVMSMPYRVPLQGSVGGKRTLVLLDNLDDTFLYSTFLGDLKSRGHLLSYVTSSSSNLKLKSFGESLYDNILHFAPLSNGFGGITADDFFQFSDEGGNLLIAVNREVGDSSRDFLAGVGVSVHKKGSEVIDHFSFAAAHDTNLQHVNVLSANAIVSPAILGSYATEANRSAVLFHGVGLNLDQNSVLAVKVLSGNPTTYSCNPNKHINDYPESIGENTVLVAAIQARNNARMVVSGSLDMFKNSFFHGTVPTGNHLFCTELSKWVFGESGVLRFRDIKHHKLDGSPPDVILHEKDRPDLPLSLYPDPEITRNSLVYRIKDEIVYSMVVEIFSNNRWAPFSADDMQMEFVMMDPYVRKTMTPDPATGRFKVHFVAPDNYGVFKFRVLYRRLGFSVLHAETQVSIRPFKHNEYERFIVSAYPYYSSALSATLAFFLFSIFFLFSDAQ